MLSSRVAFWAIFGASNVLIGPQGPLSNTLLPKTSQKAIKIIAVYEFMTWRAASKTAIYNSNFKQLAR